MISELEQANLRGMGGAGTPAAQKWRDVLEARGDEKYIVCNADESEPATFKDRELLLRTPDLVIEGMVLAALLLRAKHGYIYIRHEYHDQIDAVNEALESAARPWCLGPDCARHRLVVRRRGLRQPRRLRLRRAGGPDRGDRRAQGRAAQPSAAARDQRPVRQAHAALQRRDLRLGPRDRARTAASGTRMRAARRGRGIRPRASLARRACGSSRSAATCERPGVYEVEIGSTLGELIDLAGGVRDGLPLKAVAPSGPSGGFIPAVLTRSTSVPGSSATSRPAARRSTSASCRSTSTSSARLNLMLGAGLTVYALAEGVNMLDHAVERLAVLPQRVVRQVRSVPDRLAEARPDRRADRSSGRGRPRIWLATRPW